MSAIRLIFLSVLVSVALPQLASATAGDLDSSFAGSGFTRFGFGLGNDECRGMVVQLDGKIVLVGSAQVGDHNEVALTRYNTDGSSDATFGTNGHVTTRFSSTLLAGTPASDEGYAIALQSDGKLLVGGSLGQVPPSGNQRSLIARYNTDGSLDTTFNHVGWQAGAGVIARCVSVAADGTIFVGETNADISSTHIALEKYNIAGSFIDALFPSFSGTTSEGINAMLLMSDGSLLLGGWDAPGTGGHESFVVKLSFLSGLDTSFGTGGIIRWNPTAFEDEATGFALQTNSALPTKILVSELYSGGDTNTQLAVRRYNLDGTPDATFGSSGIVLVPGRSYLGAKRVVVQNSGANASRIWVAGDFYDGIAQKFGVAKLLLTGALDTAFNGTGIAAVNVATGGSAVSMVQSGGSPLLAGSSRNGEIEDDFTMVRLSPSGPLDPSFDSDGLRFDDIGDARAYAAHMIRDANGAFVLVGKVVVNGRSRTAIARLNSSGMLDAGFGAGGKVALQVGSGDDSLVSVAQDAQGRYVAVGALKPSVGSLQALMVRYLPNGVPDVALNGNGVWKIPVSGLLRVGDVAIQPDGRILIGASGNSPILIRGFNDGSLDGSFAGGSGIANPFTYTTEIQSIALQPDGRIVVCGPEFFTLGFSLMRFTSLGNVDFTWGEAGNGQEEVGVDAQNSSANAIQRLADGRFIAAGFAASGADFGTVLLSSNGVPDSSYDSDGREGLSLDPQNDQANAVAVLPDGRFVLAGTADAGFGDFAMTRVSSTGVQDLAFGGGQGKVLLDLRGGSRDIARSIAIDPFGRMILGGESGGLFAAARFVGDGSLVGVPEPVVAAPRLALRFAAANPFHAGTALSYDVPTAGPVALDVFDLGGAHVRSLANAITPAGQHVVTWDGVNDAGRQEPSGIYFVRLREGTQVASIKVTKLQ